MVFRIAFAVSAWFMLSGAGLVEHTPTEAQVRAAYLFNFARFVEWQGAEAREELRICVRDDPAVLQALQPAAGQLIGARRVQVREAGGDDSGCDVIYLGMKALDSPPPIRNGLLTVGAGPDARGHGAIIELVAKAGRLRFRVDRQAALQAGVRIPPNVLQLAVE